VDFLSECRRQPLPAHAHVIDLTSMPHRQRLCADAFVTLAESATCTKTRGCLASPPPVAKRGVIPAPFTGAQQVDKSGWYVHEQCARWKSAGLRVSTKTVAIRPRPRVQRGCTNVLLACGSSSSTAITSTRSSSISSVAAMMDISQSCTPRAVQISFKPLQIWATSCREPASYTQATMLVSCSTCGSVQNPSWSQS
jgi:hypothetical protein